MTAKTILFGADARAQITVGIDAVADVVRLTLGPVGRHVGLERVHGAPTISKDGATIAEVISLNPPFANMGAELMKEAAANTADVAGDGTTTATVLAQAIYSAGAKLVAAGMDPMELKRGIDAAVVAVTAELKGQSTAVRDDRDIAHIGCISSNGDARIGDLLADAMEQVGRDGVITIEDAQSMSTTLEVVEGMQLDRGYLSAHFVTQTERMEVVLEDAFVLILNQPLSTLRELMPLLEKVAKADKPLLVIADDVSGEALAALVVNSLRGSLRACAVKSPAFGDRRRAILEDIAIMTGGRAVTPDVGMRLESIALSDLGRVTKVVVDCNTTTLIGGAGGSEAIEARVNRLRGEIRDASNYDLAHLEERIAKLTGGVAVIHVGASTETELQEKKARVDDALHATRAAVEEGIVPGGGVALLRTLPALERLELLGDQRYGVDVVRRALEAPLRQIARNAGVDEALVVARVCAGTAAYGYDAASEKYGDLLDAGVIDPTKVVRVALQNAASVASLMLTTEAAVASWTRPRKNRRDP